MKIGITASTFDLFHAGHVLMLKEAREKCDYLIAAVQSDPTIDRKEKNRPIQTIFERQMQVKGCKYVDEVIVYTTENDLIDILQSFPINIRILGEEYRNKDFTGKKECEDLGIEFYFNKRNHRFSSSELRKRIYDEESMKRVVLYTTSTKS